MARNRLINIDQVVSSTGKILSVDDYGVTPPPDADGHSASASEAFQLAGLYGGGGSTARTSCQKTSFAGSADFVNHGDLPVATGGTMGSGSNGDYILARSAMVNGTPNIQSQRKALATNADGVTWGSSAQEGFFRAVTSTESEQMMVGGWVGFFNFTGNNEKGQFHTAATGVAWGVLTSPMIRMSSANDSNQVLCSHGLGSSNTSFTQDMVTLKFDDSSYQVTHAAHSYRQQRTCSASTTEHAVFHGGYVDGLSNLLSDRRKYAFASPATTIDWGMLLETNNGAGCSGNGHEALTVGGYGKNSGEKFSLSTNSASVAHGSLYESSEFGWSGSGN